MTGAAVTHSARFRPNGTEVIAPSPVIPDQDEYETEREIMPIGAQGRLFREPTLVGRLWDRCGNVRRVRVASDLNTVIGGVPAPGKDH